MAAKKEGVTYEEIVRAVRAGNFAPVYYLMGEESYYIDKVSEFIVDSALKEEERDFNLTVCYGADVTADEVVNAAKRFPMMAQRQVVWVREAQNLQGKERLSFYLEHPQPTTVLILCHKHGVLDRRKKLASDIQKAGILFESKKLYESQLPGFVSAYLRRKGVAMEQNAVMMVCESVGSDLSRLSGELDKLASTLPQAANRLAVGGRLVVESYHSLEDKTVKTFMAQGLVADVPPGLPVIPPDAQPFFRDLTRGAVKADEGEIAHNPRSASVRLRGVELTRPIPQRWRRTFASAAEPRHYEGGR